MRQKEAVPAGTEWAEKNIREFPGSPFDRIRTGWMLVTAGNVEDDKGNWNTMTAAWGGFGVLWWKDIVFVAIRPTRQTFCFLDTEALFTLSFFDETYRDALNLCGEKSGRDIDKASAAGLTPVFFQGGPVDGAVSFKEASDIIICKKIYFDDFDPALFLDAEAEALENRFNGKDFHRMFIGEIMGYRTR